MSKTQRRTLRKGARAAQDKHKLRLDKMEHRLKDAARHVDDGRTMARVIELCLADVEVLRAWLLSEYEELTSNKTDLADQPDILARLEQLEDQLAKLQSPPIPFPGRREG